MNTKSITSNIMTEPYCMMNTPFHQGRIYRIVFRISYYNFTKCKTEYKMKTVFTVPEFFHFNGNVKNRLLYFHCLDEDDLCLTSIDTSRKSNDCFMDSPETIAEITLEDLEREADAETFKFIKRKCEQCKIHDAIRLKTGCFPFIYTKYSTYDSELGKSIWHNTRAGERHYWSRTCVWSMKMPILFYDNVEISISFTKTSKERIPIYSSFTKTHNNYERKLTQEDIGKISNLKRLGLQETVKTYNFYQNKIFNYRETVEVFY